MNVDELKTSREFGVSATLATAPVIDNCKQRAEATEEIAEALRALAAENEYLRQQIKQHSHSTHFCEVCGKDNPCENDDVCYALNHELPATDAILNDVRNDFIKKLVDAIDESGAFTIADAVTVIESFATAPPSVNLAELVPPRKTAADYADEVFSNKDLAAIWNACRDEMLCRIEGK